LKANHLNPNRFVFSILNKWVVKHNAKSKRFRTARSGNSNASKPYHSQHSPTNAYARRSCRGCDTVWPLNHSTGGHAEGEGCGLTEHGEDVRHGCVGDLFCAVVWHVGYGDTKSTCCLDVDVVVSNPHSDHQLVVVVVVVVLVVVVVVCGWGVKWDGHWEDAVRTVGARDV
jgi:hypothetical protein